MCLSVHFSEHIFTALTYCWTALSLGTTLLGLLSASVNYKLGAH